MTGAAGVLQIASSQRLVHNGADAIAGNAPHQVPIRRRKNQRRENAVFFDVLVTRNSMQVIPLAMTRRINSA